MPGKFWEERKYFLILGRLNRKEFFLVDPKRKRHRSVPTQQDFRACIPPMAQTDQSRDSFIQFHFCEVKRLGTAAQAPGKPLSKAFLLGAVARAEIFNSAADWVSSSCAPGPAAVIFCNALIICFKNTC